MLMWSLHIAPILFLIFLLNSFNFENFSKKFVKKRYVQKKFQCSLQKLFFFIFWIFANFSICVSFYYKIFT